MYYGQFELDRIIFEKYFKDKRNGYFVECGAFDGVSESTCKFFEESLGWGGINIEPLPYAFNLLLKNRPHCVNFNFALSNYNGTAVFKQAIHPQMGNHFGNGSLKHSKEHLQDLNNQGCSFEDIHVEVRKFSHGNILPWVLCRGKCIDLFVLDVEGHELEALDGILPIPVEFLPKVFCIEYTICGLDNLKEKLKDYYTFDGTYTHNAFFVKNV